MKLFLKSLATILVIAFVSTPASAGLVISTTDRPADGLQPFNGVTSGEGQAPFATFTLPASATIDSVEVHAGGFNASPGQILAWVFVTPGRNPFVDVPDAIASFNLPSLKMNNVMATLNVSLASNFFEVFFVAPSGHAGGALSTRNGALHDGTATGVFSRGQRFDERDQTYVALYQDIRPTPEPSTFLLAAIGGLTFFAARRRTRR